MDANGTTRRPVAARRSRWAAATARQLARTGIRPNQVSVLSVVSAGLAGAALIAAAHGGGGWRIALLIGGATCMELRLLCNLLDGMLAIEGGMQTRSGVLFNELPDRISDALILVCAGYAIPQVGRAADLGWAAALLAVMTAYVRALAGSAGAAQDFSGPMAKQQRMQLMVVACLAEVALTGTSRRGYALAGALLLIIAGCAATVVRRTLRAARELEAS